MRFISSNVESTGACAPSADLATPMSMMLGTSVNASRRSEGATRKVDGKRAPEVKVVLAFRVCAVEGERPSLGRIQRRQALGQLLDHKRLHFRLPSGPRRTPRIFAPRAKPRRTPWHLGFAPCNDAQRRHHLRRMSMHRTRDRARRRGASRANNLLDPAAPILKSSKNVQSYDIRRTVGGTHHYRRPTERGGRDGRRRVQGTLRPHAPLGRASGGRP